MYKVNALEGSKASKISGKTEDCIDDWTPYESLRLTTSILKCNGTKDYWNRVSELMHMQPEAKERPLGFFSCQNCVTQFDNLKRRHRTEISVRIHAQETTCEALIRVIAKEVLNYKKKEIEVADSKQDFKGLKTESHNSDGEPVQQLLNYSQPASLQRFNPSTVIEDAVQFKSPYESADDSVLNMADQTCPELNGEIKAPPDERSPTCRPLNRGNKVDSPSPYHEKRHFDFETLQNHVNTETTATSAQPACTSSGVRRTYSAQRKSVKQSSFSAKAGRKYANAANRELSNNLPVLPKDFFIFDNIPYSERLGVVARTVILNGTLLKNGVRDKAVTTQTETANPPSSPPSRRLRNKKSIFDLIGDAQDSFKTSPAKDCNNTAEENPQQVELYYPPEASEDESRTATLNRLEEFSCPSPSSHASSMPNSDVERDGTQPLVTNGLIFPEITDCYSLSKVPNQMTYIGDIVPNVNGDSEFHPTNPLDNSIEIDEEAVGGPQNKAETTSKESLELLLGLIIVHPCSSTFFTLSPEFYGACQPNRHMDLMTIKRKLDAGEITTVPQLERDLSLTFFNVTMTHRQGHPVAKKAIKIFEHVKTVFQDFREREALDSQDSQPTGFENNDEASSTSSVMSSSSIEEQEATFPVPVPPAISPRLVRELSPDIVNITRQTRPEICPVRRPSRKKRAVPKSFQ